MNTRYVIFHLKYGLIEQFRTLSLYNATQHISNCLCPERIGIIHMSGNEEKPTIVLHHLTFAQENIVMKQHSFLTSLVI